jgi:hypothetical protein
VDEKVAENPVGGQIFRVMDIVRAFETPNAGLVIPDLESSVRKLVCKGLARVRKKQDGRQNTCPENSTHDVPPYYKENIINN